MKHLKNFKSYNEGLASAFGNLLSKIENTTKDVLGRIGRTGNDEDLAREVLQYVNNMQTDYNRNEKDMSSYAKILKVDGIDNYIFYGHVFPRDKETKYRVDVIKVLDRNFEKEPYKVIISKIVDRGVKFRGLGDNSIQPLTLATPNASKDEKPYVLDISQQIAREIYNRVSTVYELTNKNTKGDARGGQNTIDRQRGTTNAKLPGDKRENKNKQRLTFTYR